MDISRYIGSCILAVSVIFSSCQPHSMSPVEYVRYIEDQEHGFLKTSVINKWSYSVQYKPPSYIYLKEKPADFDKTGYQKRLDQLGNWAFFNIYVKHSQTSKAAPLRLITNSLDEYNDALSYYLTRNQGNFRLYTDTDTLSPQIYVFENNYNLSPEDVFVVGFDLKDGMSPGKMTLAYNDELLKTGIVKFSFRKEDLLKEPHINF